MKLLGEVEVNEIEMRYTISKDELAKGMEIKDGGYIKEVQLRPELNGIAILVCYPKEKEIITT